MSKGLKLAHCYHWMESYKNELEDSTAYCGHVAPKGTLKKAPKKFRKCGKCKAIVERRR